MVKQQGGQRSNMTIEQNGNSEGTPMCGLGILSTALYATEAIISPNLHDCLHSVMSTLRCPADSHPMTRAIRESFPPPELFVSTRSASAIGGEIVVRLRPRPPVRCQKASLRRVHGRNPRVGCAIEVPQDAVRSELVQS